MRSFLLATLLFRAVLVVASMVVTMLFLLRTFRNGPVTTALVDYFLANTFAMAWYVLANIELWFWQTAYMQTFGIIVWIPLGWAITRLLIVLWRVRR